MGSFESKPTYNSVSSEEIDVRIKQQLEKIKAADSYKVNELEKEIKYLKSVNVSLEKENKNLKENISQEAGMSLTNLSSTEIKLMSEKNIDHYIENILKNPDTNINWLPDAVEKRIYKNIMKIILNSLETTVENSEIKLFGHRIRFVMDPIIDDSKA